MNAYQWNSIESIMESGAVYGEDYEVSRNGLPLIYSPERQEFYASNDELMVKPITRDVARTSNSGGGYLWALIAVHILHLIFGFITSLSMAYVWPWGPSTRAMWSGSNPSAFTGISWVHCGCTCLRFCSS